MGLTSTASTVSKLADLAETLYKRVEAMREQVQNVRETVEGTNDRVVALETELAEQRAILDAIADANGVDVEAVVADATADADDGTDGGAAANATTDANDADATASDTTTDGAAKRDGA